MDNRNFINDDGQTKETIFTIDLNNQVNDNQNTTDPFALYRVKVSGKGRLSLPQIAVDHDETQDHDHDPERKRSSVISEKENKSEKEEKVKLLPQVIAALGANMGAFAFGTVICWSATAVPNLKRDDDFRAAQEEPGEEISEAAASWISSIITLGALAACLPAGFAVDNFGRRLTMLLISIPFVGGWLLMYFAPNIPAIIAGRFITGFCGGIFSIAAPIFITETSEARIRGMLTSGYDTMTCTGILFQLVTGTYLSWRNQCLLCGVVPIIVFAILFFVPESPRYLMDKKMEDQATKNLCWLRGISSPKNPLIMAEMKELQGSTDSSTDGSFGQRVMELIKPSVRKAVGIGLMLFFFQVFTGLFAVMFYRVEIFQSAKVDLDEYTSSIIVGTMDMVASVCCASVVDRFGRKVLMVTSEVIMAIALTALGSFFYVKEAVDEDFAQESLGWLPLLSLMCFVGGYSVGMGALPYSVIPEILPQRVRGLASSLLTAAMWGMAFLVGRFFKDLMDGVGEGGCYWFFAVCCSAGAVSIFFFVPETRGKSLEEVQLLFQEKPPKN